MTRDPRAVERKNRDVPKHVAASSSANVNIRPLLLNERLVSKPSGLFKDYPMAG